MDIEDKYRLLALKKAAIVMNALADSMNGQEVKEETKSLAWSISWAVTRIEELVRATNRKG
jgi:hypothetical protein